MIFSIEERFESFIKSRDFTWPTHILISTNTRKEFVNELRILVDICYTIVDQENTFPTCQENRIEILLEKLKNKLQSLDLDWHLKSIPKFNLSTNSDCDYSNKSSYCCLSTEILENLLQFIVEKSFVDQIDSDQEITAVEEEANRNDQYFQYFWSKFKNCKNIANIFMKSSRIDEILFNSLSKIRNEKILCQILQIIDLITSEKAKSDDIYIKKYLPILFKMIKEVENVHALAIIYNISGQIITLSQIFAPISDVLLLFNKYLEDSKILDEIGNYFEKKLKIEENQRKFLEIQEECDLLFSIQYLLKTLFVFHPNLKQIFSNYIFALCEFNIQFFAEMPLINKLYSVTIVKYFVEDFISKSEQLNDQLIGIIENSLESINKSNLLLSFDKHLMPDSEYESLNRMFVAKVLHLIASYVNFVDKNKKRNIDFLQKLNQEINSKSLKILNENPDPKISQFLKLIQDKIAKSLTL